MKRLLSISFILLIMISILPLEISLSSCNISFCSELNWGYSDAEFDHYDIIANNITLSGTTFDPTGQNISPQLIDRLTSEVETCLDTAFNGTLPDDVVHNSLCSNNHFPIHINRAGFEVKIPNDWVINCDGTQQLLPTPVKSGPNGCLAKGETPSAQCPCRWRAGIKCPNILITTPSFYLYKDVLVRYTTGCQNPWASPQLAACASPSTTPLSDGSDPNNGL